MTVQYGILDDQGELFGLRGTTYGSLEAAEAAMEFLRSVRREAELQANEARHELKRVKGSSEEVLNYRAHLKETVARWENQKERSYVIRRREVTPWTPLG